jgi:hypothetical protein
MCYYRISYWGRRFFFLTNPDSVEIILKSFFTSSPNPVSTHVPMVSEPNVLHMFIVGGYRFFIYVILKSFH